MNIYSCIGDKTQEEYDTDIKNFKVEYDMVQPCRSSLY